jgi:hypothetical protein
MPSTQTPRSRRRLSTPLERLLRATEAALRRGDSRRHCLIHAGGLQALEVEVAKPRITRAVRVMRQILGALDRDGCKVTLVDYKTFVKVDGQDLRIRLREGYHQPPT